MALGSNLADGLRGGVPGGLTEGALDLIGLNSYQLDPYSDSRVQAHAENEGFRIRYYMGESTGNKKLRSSYKGLMIKKYMRTYFGEQVLNSIKEGRPMTKKQMESTYKTIAREAFIFADEPIPKQLRSSDRIRSF